MAAHRSVLRSHAETPRVLTGADLWGNASAIAAHQAWVRAFTNASIIIGVQKSGTTALGALLRIVLGLREKSHRKELHMFATPPGDLGARRAAPLSRRPGACQARHSH